MKTAYKSFIMYSLSILITLLLMDSLISIEKTPLIKKVYSSSSPKSNLKSKKARMDYFNRMLRDPITKTIPQDIREKELNFALKLADKTNTLNKTAAMSSIEWKEAGPNNVGGRTRALAIDVTNSDVILAGGASGGIWKSIDKGNSWVLKSSVNTILSVTSIAQDPRPGKNNIWYYTTGEWGSNLAGTQATNFTGDGIYKSTDNGETWNVLASTLSRDVTGWNSSFDYVNKIEISPITGSIFVATQGNGIFRSTNEGASFDLILGGNGEHINSDISVSSDGKLVAVISSPFQGFTPQNSPGVYKSTNDGGNWTDITPSSLPTSHLRSVVEIAPSNTNVAYLLTFTGEFISDDHEDVRFHNINIGNGASEDRSANMASFPFNEGQARISQADYNLTVAIKPNDENFVLIGATSLFRSTNGFSSKPNNAKLDWIGGYNSNYFFYPNFHPDIHSFAFDPNNPNAMWWGHDGGLSYTDDIRNTSYSELFPWVDKNNGYNVTQFYHITISQDADDARIMGGTQDNGTPYFKFDGSIADEIDDLSSGDGSYSYFAQSHAYVSSQNGTVLRVGYDGQENPNQNVNWSVITPTDASNQYFINPFCVDPNDENVMYYPAGDVLWRNNQLSSIPNFENKTSVGWSRLNNSTVPTGYGIFSLTASTTPAHILYYSASSTSGGAPKLYKLVNANTSTNTPMDISIPGVSDGAYIKDIGVNPDDANEILVVLSNYNIIGLYHSLDGGQSYSAVEGNLEGSGEDPGPSLRGATILPNGNSKTYFLATSIGVFSAKQLDGNNTVWIQEGNEVMGNVIVSSITSRKSDGRIVAGTHGRGAFLSTNTSSGQAVAAVNVTSLNLQSSPDNPGTTSFELENNGEADLNFNISVTGNFGVVLPKTNKSMYVLRSANVNSSKYQEYREKSNFKRNVNEPKESIFETPANFHSISSLNGEDKIILDDGDDAPDSFLGWGNDNAFNWYNEFNVEGNNFTMDSFEFFVRSDQSSSNEVYAAVYDEESNLLSEGTLQLELSENGSWFVVTLTPTLNFLDGSTFFIEIYSDNSVFYPAGADDDAQVPNKSYYYNGASWVSLNTITGFENGAFLLRAIGTNSDGSNNLVTVDPSSGIVSPGGSQLVTLTLDAQNLGVGNYTGEVNISTNGGNINIPIDFIVGLEDISGLPNNFELHQNYPNPFNPSTVISFSLPQETNVTLSVYDILGKEIVKLVEGKKNAGYYNVSFDASSIEDGISSGLYIYRLSTDHLSHSKKMMLIK